MGCCHSNTESDSAQPGAQRASTHIDEPPGANASIQKVSIQVEEQSDTRPDVPVTKVFAIPFGDPHPPIRGPVQNRPCTGPGLPSSGSSVDVDSNISQAPEATHQAAAIENTEDESLIQERIAALMVDGQSSLSLRLCKVLEKAGGSEILRQLHKEVASAEEILGTIQSTAEFKMPIHVFKCGSYYEGSVTLGLVSDMDTIYCHDSPELVLSIEDSSPLEQLNLNQFLVFRSECTYPGYVKLQHISRGKPLTVYDMNSARIKDVDHLGNYCKGNYTTGANNENGPADAYFSEEGKHLVDSVLALQCRKIPLFARHWLRRQRKYNWPSKKQLAKMSEMGCMVVSAGFDDSCEKGLEWRLSFSLQERYLMSKLNPVQHKVYILLKLIKKDLLPENSITSYHCKTCILHAAENTPSVIWREDNIIKCLMLCLRILWKCAKQRYLPHFFVKDHNLFRRESLKRSLTRLSEILKSLLDDVVRVLFRIRTDNVGTMLLSAGDSVYEDVDTAEVKSAKFDLKFQVITNIWQTVRGLLVPSERRYLRGLVQVLDDTQKGKLAPKHPRMKTAEAMSYVLPRIHLHLVLGLASSIRMQSDPRILQLSVRVIDHLFKKSIGTDCLSTGLAKATVMLAFGFKKECFGLLQEMKSTLDPDVMSVCSCSHELITTHTPNHNTEDKTCGMSIKAVLSTFVANCVVFLPSETSLVPAALQYEALARENDWYTEDWVKVDAKVYLHFLLYLVSSQLKSSVEQNAAIDDLMSTIGGDPNLGHKWTALNLLGWMFVQEENQSMARWCFLQSLKIRSTGNAAKFHLNDMFNGEIDVIMI